MEMFARHGKRGSWELVWVGLHGDSGENGIGLVGVVAGTGNVGAPRNYVRSQVRTPSASTVLGKTVRNKIQKRVQTRHQRVTDKNQNGCVATMLN